jgi:predicted nucleic-acid-binding protein
MRAVDTNVLVRLIARDDAGQAAAADRFIRPGAWVSAVTLVEAVWVLASSYGHSAADLADAIEMLLNHRDLTIEDPESVTAALRQFRLHPRLGFTDCLILELARKAGHLPLGTFDRSLAKLEGCEKL